MSSFLGVPVKDSHKGWRRLEAGRRYKNLKKNLFKLELSPHLAEIHATKLDPTILWASHTHGPLEIMTGFLMICHYISCIVGDFNARLGGTCRFWVGLTSPRTARGRIDLDEVAQKLQMQLRAVLDLGAALQGCIRGD